MALTFAQLVQPLSQTQELALLTAALQGVGFVTQNGASGAAPVGSGFVTVTGPTLAAAQVVLKINASGQLGTGTFSYSLDGGNTFTGPFTIPSNGNYILPTVGLAVQFSNGLYTPSGGSFQAGETYTFSTFLPTFPITNWTSGGVANTLIQIDAQALSSLSTVIALIGAGGLVGTSTGPWLELLAAQLYNLLKIQPLQTQGLIQFSCSAAAGPYTIQAGTIFAQDMINGFVYYNLTGGTLPSGGNLTLTFGAIAAAAAYNNVPSYNPSNPTAGGIVNLQTALPGVTIANGLITQQPVHLGTGTGTLVTAGTPVQDAQTITVRIIVGGGTGVGTFTYQVGSGAPVGPQTIPSSSFPFGATGCTGTFSGTFTSGDEYIFRTGWITQLGNDAEQDASLQQRCTNQWGSLAPGPPAGMYTNWAKLASAEVVYVAVAVDPTVGGQVDVTLAGAGDVPVSSAAVAAVQAYLDLRIPLTTSVLVQNVTQVSIPIAGTIYCPAADVGSVIIAIPTVLTNLQVAVGIAGTLYYSDVVQALSNIAGVRNLEGITVNGGTSDYVLSANQVALLTNSLQVIGF